MFNISISFKDAGMFNSAMQTINPFFAITFHCKTSGFVENGVSVI